VNINKKGFKQTKGGYVLKLKTRIYVTIYRFPKQDLKGP